MIVFVEGRDGSGKTTLVKMLQEKGYNILEPIPRGMSNDGKLWLSMLEDNKDKLYIMDRSFLSEIVYRTVDNRPLEMSVISLFELLHNRNFAIIYCDSPTAYEDSLQRGEDNILDKKVSILIHNTYARLLNLLHCMILTYDWHNIYRYEYILQYLEVLNDNSR